MTAVSPPNSYGRSLHGIYIDKCEQYHCKKNSYLLKTLPSQPNVFDSLRELDLNLNFVGRVGVRAVVEVVRVSPNIQKLCLADNFLNNDSVKELAAALMHHESLSYLDLSRNPISHVAGKILSDFCSKNAKVHHVLLEDTLINPALVRIIENKARLNRTGNNNNKAKQQQQQGAAATTTAADSKTTNATPAAAQQTAADGSPLYPTTTTSPVAVDVSARREESSSPFHNKSNNNQLVQERREEQQSPTTKQTTPQQQTTNQSAAPTTLHHGSSSSSPAAAAGGGSSSSSSVRPSSGVVSPLALLTRVDQGNHPYVQMLIDAQTYYPPLYSIKLMLDISDEESNNNQNSTMSLLRDAVAHLDSTEQQQPPTTTTTTAAAEQQHNKNKGGSSNINNHDSTQQQQQQNKDGDGERAEGEVLDMVFKLVGAGQPGKYSALEMVYQVAVTAYPQTITPDLINKKTERPSSAGKALGLVLTLASNNNNNQQYNKLHLLQQAAKHAFPEQDVIPDTPIPTYNTTHRGSTVDENVVRLGDLEYLFEAAARNIQQQDNNNPAIVQSFIGLGVLCEHLQGTFSIPTTLPMAIKEKEKVTTRTWDYSKEVAGQQQEEAAAAVAAPPPPAASGVYSSAPPPVAPSLQQNTASATTQRSGADGGGLESLQVLEEVKCTMMGGASTPYFDLLLQSQQEGDQSNDFVYYNVQSDMQGLDMVFTCANQMQFKSFGLDVLAQASSTKDDDWYAMKLVQQLVGNEKAAGEEEWGGLGVIFSLIGHEGEKR
eukprot:TRINITY_DN66028_c6_g7_i1.p1 TRINITY_DN66028_c6_g7~~TRINITY_DN66028_c6_g7_i1.p1  ORF type:complete len:772 (+),score=183.55 TRINITY_DN66028_c6_g7_i1:32-2347(+)